MEYNTQRPQLKINDYGRNIYKLIQYAKGIEDREKRNRTAQAIVNIMARHEEGKITDENKRRFWVHLMILADWDLDVDVPYEISPSETVEFTPRRIAYAQDGSRFHHYGHIMEAMVKRAAEYPDGEERDALIERIAHAMKRDYLLWNRDTVEDDVINKQMEAIKSAFTISKAVPDLNAQTSCIFCIVFNIIKPFKQKLAEVHNSTVFCFI